YIWMTKIIGFASHFAGRFEWSVAGLPRPQFFLILFYLSVIFYLIRSRTRKNFAARICILASLLFLIFAIKIPFAYSLVKSPDSVSLFFFDVGQGDAILLTSPHGKNYLIDFGGITKNYSAVSDRCIAPLFKAEG